jgi:cell wall-associated NlpC family hydrolase
MRYLPFGAYLALASLGLLVIAGCTQAAINRSAHQVLSSVILAGGPTTSSRRSPDPSRAPSATPSARRVLGTAEEYLGVRYKWGGNTPSTGFDCSGYVKYVFADQGLRLPRTSREQARAGERVTPQRSALREGDLMLFAEKGKAISHVAIYAGGGRIIHSSSSGGGVRYDDLDTRRGRWFASHMVAARRLVHDGRSLIQALDLISQPGLPFDPPDRAPRP